MLSKMTDLLRSLESDSTIPSPQHNNVSPEMGEIESPAELSSDSEGEQSPVNHSLFEIPPDKFEDEPVQDRKGSSDWEWINTSERFKNLKISKNQLTIKKTTVEFIEKFRLQEAERYKNPTKPWVYYNEDGSTCVVAPICKKNISNSAKAREHFIFKPERPACITILCLARDAARYEFYLVVYQTEWELELIFAN